MTSRSLPASGSSEIVGSAGIGGFSRTGSGGAGGRAVVSAVVDGGGGIGRATGGFFLPHAPTTASAITTTHRRYRWSRCLISLSVSVLSRTSRIAPRASRQRLQFGYPLLPSC